MQCTVTLLNENWNPGYISSSGRMQNFLSVFTVYFPAAIGILAGANVSGDLKVIFNRLDTDMKDDTKLF